MISGFHCFVLAQVETVSWSCGWRWCGDGFVGYAHWNYCSPNCGKPGDGAVRGALLTEGRWINNADNAFWTTCFFVSIHSQAPALCSPWLAPAKGNWLHFWHCLLGFCVELGSLLLCCSCERKTFSLVYSDSSATQTAVLLLCTGSIKLKSFEEFFLLFVLLKTWFSRFHLC